MMTSRTTSTATNTTIQLPAAEISTVEASVRTAETHDQTEIFYIYERLFNTNM